MTVLTMTAAPSVKICSCAEHEGPNPLPESEFYPDSRRPDGLRNPCKACIRRAAGRRYWADPDKARRTDRAQKYRRYWADPVKGRKKSREDERRRRQVNPAILGLARDRTRRWQQENPERNRERVRRSAARKNAASRDTARHHHQEWTGPQLELAARGDLTAQQIAVMTGRTRYAVNSARRRLRSDPRYQNLAGLSEAS